VEEPWVWKCMRCGHDYEESYDSKGTQIERSCPQCRSNSVRPLETLAKAKAKEKAKE
jgi:DNA-directed RNA polymerase subunit RPC12/RpoP